ncbi:hypothetical protein NL108_003747 [Boleophthalmus pectinirostris]|nr:hypothetical protein NL108_003747 [Boleophthalmus pectinirostris]
MEAVLLFAEEGTKLEIQCLHSYAQGNMKYFCKDPCDYKDFLITSRQTNPNSRYSLRDNGNTFSVTISGVTKKDSGTENSSSNMSLQNITSTEVLYIGISLGALLFILLIAGVIFIKQRHRGIRKPRGDNMTLTDPFRYNQRQFKDSSEPDPLTAQHHRGSTQEPTSDIYVETVEEGYSSVCFTKHRDRVTCTDSESAVYSQVKTA